MKLELIKSIRENTIGNYILPGLSSSLLAAGKVRLFESSRQTHELITPHSHRFDFLCLVLQGMVWQKSWYTDKTGDEYMATTLDYLDIGQYVESPNGKVDRYKTSERTFYANEWYGMTYDEIHSIRFDTDTAVLFFESEDKTDKTTILQPYVNGKVVPTFKVEDWMYHA